MEIIIYDNVSIGRGCDTAKTILFFFFVVQNRVERDLASIIIVICSLSAIV